LLIEYTDFVRIGQLKLSERTGQRSGLFVAPTYPRVGQARGTDDLQLPINPDLL
jgi:hypothetical protein